MKKSLIFLVVFLMFVTLGALAQEITPRGFGDEPTATAPVTPEATEETAEAEEATEETGPTTADLDQRLKSLEDTAGHFILDGDYKALVDKVAELNSSKKAQQEEIESLRSSARWNMWGIILLFTFDLAVLILAFFTRKRKNEDEEETTHDDYHDDHTGHGRATHMVIVIGLLTLGLVAQSAKADCIITSIKEGAVIVKEQAAAPISIGVNGCTDVKSVELAAKGVTVTDVTQQGNVVTAKVKAGASAQEGPTAFRITTADGTKIKSSDKLFFLVLDPATATINKAAQSAESTASRVARELKTLARDVKTLPTKAEVQAIAAQSASKAELDALRKEVRDLQVLVSALKEDAETQGLRTELLSKIALLLAKNQEEIGNTEVKKGLWGKKPLNPEVAEAAARIQELFPKHGE